MRSAEDQPVTFTCETRLTPEERVSMIYALQTGEWIRIEGTADGTLLIDITPERKEPTS